MPNKTLAGLKGAIVIPTGFDQFAPIGGLAPLLRHALALQQAGVEEICLLGADAVPPQDARLTVPVKSGIMPDRRTIVVPAEVTCHRLLPARLARLPVAEDDLFRIGGSRPILVAGADRVKEAVNILTKAQPSVNVTELPLESGEFVLAAADKKQRKKALMAHLRSLRKPTGGYFENLYMRPLSMYMTRLLSGTPVTPNQMSIVTLLLALVSAYLVSLPGPKFYIIGGLLHIFMRVVDCVDGELARLRYQGSRFGEWLDSVGDGIGLAALLAAVTVHVVREDPGWLAVGVIGVAAWCIVQVLQWYAAVRTGGGGCFQHIEWGHRSQDKNPVERLAGQLELFFRIDAISTMYGVFIVTGHMKVLLVLHVIFSLVAVVYFSSQVKKVQRTLVND